MLATLFESASDIEDPALITPTARWSWCKLAERAAVATDEFAALAQRRVGLIFGPVPSAFAKLFALDRLRCDIFLMPDSLTPDDAAQWGRDLKLAAVISTHGGNDDEAFELDLSDATSGTGQSSVTILTSGTTGKPKAVRHTWRSLARPTRQSEPGPRWLLTFRPNLYAGMQVILQCFVNGGALVLPGAGDTAQQVADLITEAGAEYASATPSYWRWLLTFSDTATLSQSAMKQLTLGGEVVPQAVLDMLKQHFPAARIVHVYATTELGRCFSVTDAQAGFPAKFLEGVSEDGVELRIVEGELVVRSANRMVGYDRGHIESASQWFATGDLVEQVGDRVNFVGRRSDMINVGGNKVHPSEIERVILGVPGVADARVFGKRSSIAGELVACDLVAEPGAEPSSVEQAVRKACLGQLASYQRPRILRFVSSIALTAAGKKARK